MTVTIAFFIVASTGLTSWLLFKLMIGFVFAPAKPLTIAGFKIQGLIPRYRNQLVQQIGEWINTKALPQLKLEEKLNNPGTLEKLMPIIEAHIDDFLQNKLTKEMPMISMFVGDKTMLKLKETFLQEITQMLPKLLQTFAEQIQQKIDATIVLHQLSGHYPDHKIQSIFNTRLQKELTKGTNFALFFGLIAGLLQVIVLYWIL